VPGSSLTVDLKEQVTATFSHNAPRYDTGVAFFQPLASRLVQLATLFPGERVLDVGCGAGACLIPAAEAVGPGGQVTGIDLSEQMLERAAAEAARRGLCNTLLRKADAEDPPFPDASFDAVLASNLMFLLPHPDRAARRYLEILRPGGRFGFTWCVAGEPRWRPVFAAADAYAPGTTGFEAFLRRPPFNSVPDAEEMLAECGFAAITTTTRSQETRYESPDQWWEACWASAPRLLWQNIPPADRLAAREAAFSRLDSLREPDGALIRRTTFGYTFGRRPFDS
jgi:ubiquinone/menaquinone biosynthesis C-methylase UbiE